MIVSEFSWRSNNLSSIGEIAGLFLVFFRGLSLLDGIKNDVAGLEPIMFEDRRHAEAQLRVLVQQFLNEVDNDGGISSLGNERVIGFAIKNLLFHLLFDELIVGNVANWLGATHIERELQGEHVEEGDTEAPRINFLRIW